jgi:hypothetical protein
MGAVVVDGAGGGGGGSRPTDAMSASRPGKRVAMGCGEGGPSERRGEHSGARKRERRSDKL